MKKYQHISFITGILVVLCYLTFTLLAYNRYPMPYSPIRNWLTDLGNINLNPHGAIFYNKGIISTGLLLLLFFLGLSQWKTENKKVQIIRLLLTQTFGIAGSICMLMSAIYPMNFLEVHKFWSSSLYIMLSTGFAFSVVALKYHQEVPKWLLILGHSTPLMVILTSFLPTVYVLEWNTVLLFLSYVSLIGVVAKPAFCAG